MPELADFGRVVVFTGAGMSAEGGVPTDRGRGGIRHQCNCEDIPPRVPRRQAMDRNVCADFELRVAQGRTA